MALSKSELFSPWLWRSCLRALEAPFASETSVMRAYGCTWAEIRTALENDTWPPNSSATSRVRTVQLSANASTEVPKGEMTGEECWAALVEAAKARATAANELQHREVRITGSEPIGIVVMGDMHVGSVGVDYARLEGVVRSLESVERLFAVSIGDILDSMIWRTVMHEGRKSPVDFPGEVRAAAQFLQRLNANGKLIGVCAGNHDLISGKLTGLAALDTVMESVCRDVPYHPYQLDLTVVMDGNVDYLLRLRHKVSGNSSWNPAHGVGKAHRFDDGDADVICAGHTHRSGVAELRHKGRMRYGVQVGAYKVAALDDYAL
jgi:UDP-2,3-diacylglucosamine pyrophosphatase LpxH